MIKTIICDLGGVYFTDGSKNAINEISTKFNIPKEKVKNTIMGGLGIKYRIGEIDEKEFWKKAQLIWGTHQDPKLLSGIWLEEYKLIKGTEDIIKELNNKGYEVLFLSNNTAERVTYLEEKYHFKQNFKDGIFSHIAKIVKPKPKIYGLLLEKTKSKPEEILYVDDKEKFLKPAKELGMRTLLFKNPEQLKQDLKELGVNLE